MRKLQNLLLYQFIIMLFISSQSQLDKQGGVKRHTVPSDSVSLQLPFLIVASICEEDGLLHACGTNSHVILQVPYCWEGGGQGGAIRVHR